MTQITPQNVSQLKAQWTFQTRLTPNFQTTPLLVDNVLYVTGFNGNAWAIDARSGRQIWRYRRNMPDDFRGCCGPNNRGMAVHGDKLFLGTGDAHLVALDIKTGDVVWDVGAGGLHEGLLGDRRADCRQGQSHSRHRGRRVRHPRVHRRLRCEHRQTGLAVLHRGRTRRSRAGRPGRRDRDAYLRGGGSIWVSGTYDPEQNLVFFGTGNPGPDYFSPAREGDNLYTCSAVALDADTGQLKWHFQFTPHDVHDWDSTQVPVLADLTINGTPRKTMLFANRNGFFYVLDRTNGQMILAKPFVTQNWAKEISPEGRPILVPGINPSEEGSVKVCPDLGGGTNFFSPSYDPTQRLFFVNARETCAVYYSWNEPFRRGGAVRIGRHDAAARAAQLRGAARHRSVDRRAQVGIPLSDDVVVRRPVDGVRARVLG